MCIALKNTIHIIIFFFAVGISTQQSFCTTINITDTFKAILLEKEVTFLYDEEDLEIEEVIIKSPEIFKTLPKSNFNFGFVDKSMWFKLNVHNYTKSDKELFLEVVNPYIKHIQAYVVANDSIFSSLPYGSQYPEHKKPTAHFNYLFNLKIPKQQASTIYLQIKNPNAAVIFSLLLWEKATRISYMEREKYTVFFYFFFLFFVLGIIIACQIILKSFSYHWFYIISAFLFIFFIFIDLGLFNFLILGHPSLKTIPLLFLIVSLYLSFSSLMLEHFFNEGRTFLFFRIFYKTVYTCGFAFAVLDILLFLIIGLNYPYWLVKLSLSFYVAFIIILTLNAIVNLLYKVRITENIALLIGCLGHLVGILFLIFQFFGVLPKLILHKENFLNTPFPYTLSTNIFITAGFSFEISVIFLMLIYRLVKSWEKNLHINKELSLEKVKNYSSLIKGIELERERIAQDLHDGLGVMLSSVKMKLGTLFDSNSPSIQQDKLNSIVKDIDTAHEEVRIISRNLMSKTLTKLGLQPAIEEMLNKIKETHPEIELTFFNNTNIKLKETVSLNIYRIIQELINNIVKHALADEVTIQLIQHNKHLSIMVEDNGIGFNLSDQPHGIGLENIKYRVQSMDGTLNIDSSLGRGTSVSFELPLNNICT